MSEPTILIVPPQGLTPKDKRELHKIGVVVIEMEDPQQARLIRATSELSSTDLLGAAAAAIATNYNTEKEFGSRVAKLLIDAAKKPAPVPTQHKAEEE